MFPPLGPRVSNHAELRYAGIGSKYSLGAIGSYRNFGHSLSMWMSEPWISLIKYRAPSNHLFFKVYTESWGWYLILLENSQSCQFSTDISRPFWLSISPTTSKSSDMTNLSHSHSSFLNILVYKMDTKVVFCETICQRIKHSTSSLIVSWFRPWKQGRQNYTSHMCLLLWMNHWPFQGGMGPILSTCQSVLFVSSEFVPHWGISISTADRLGTQQWQLLNQLC